MSVQTTFAISMKLFLRAEYFVSCPTYKNILKDLDNKEE